MKEKKRQTYFEVGLAVIIAIVMGIAGNMIEDKNTSDKNLTALVTVENAEAKEVENSAAEKHSMQEAVNIDSEAEKVIADGQYPIMGESAVTVEQMAAWFEQNAASYPVEVLGDGGADTIEAFRQIYIDEAEAEGVAE